jgi:hypothetical protein
VSPVKYEKGFYIPEDDILHSHCHENLKSYIVNISLSQAKPSPITDVLAYVTHSTDNFFNPILFAICTGTLSKSCKNSDIITPKF